MRNSINGLVVPWVDSAKKAGELIEDLLTLGGGWLSALPSEPARPG